MESWIGGFFEIAWQEGAVFVIMIVVAAAAARRPVSSAEACASDEAGRRLDCGVAVRGALAASSPRRTYVIGIGVSGPGLHRGRGGRRSILIYGFTGLLSFAQLGFWGIGGYATALTVVTFRRQLLVGPGVGGAAERRRSPSPSVFPTLRTNRHAFVIVTLTFALLANA